MSTPAHIDKSTLTVEIYDPEHAQRITSALFTKTRDEILKDETLCWCCGCPAASAGPLELHHCNVERMLAEIIDWNLLASAAKAGEVGWTHNQRQGNINWDWDGFLAKLATDPMACYDYVDNMHLNGLPLCIVGGVPVLMDDGSEKLIEDIEVGDMVIGHDLEPHKVLNKWERDTSEDIFVRGPLALTTGHRILTKDGFVAASLAFSIGECYEVGVSNTQVVGLRSEQLQVVNSVVGLNPVLMVDAFATGQSSSDVLLHDEDVCHDIAPLVAFPDIAANVPLGIGFTADESFGADSRQSIESREPALVGTVSGVCQSPTVETLRAKEARSFFRGCELTGTDSEGIASLRASGVPFCDVLVDGEGTAANSAVLNDSGLTVDGRWSPVGDFEQRLHTGKVYDIEVADSHSFIAGNVAVHNCKPHHTGVDEGIHNMDYPRWLEQRYAKEGYKYSDKFTEDAETLRLAAIAEDEVCDNP